MYKLWESEGYHYVLQKILNQNSRHEWIVAHGPWTARKDAKNKLEELNND
jgi:hypothetical protein